ncbi:putative D-glycerate permease [Palleronia aestuarii]|uniref:Putative D-glycerate permease n=1 Tax=Palleronia aestuarii TaxID=568105 RepID=A0A2W7NF42_9RHOB|nr:GntP family permease [Palleronia aestuarii]PZX19045.1 putative D-glycerate permease [Palleronia aestuarii]
MSGWLLIVLLVLAIAFIVLGTARWKVHPFLILLVTAYGLGLLAGLGAEETVMAIVDGFGGTLGGIGIIIAAGTVIGVVLERSGGAQVMAEAIIGLIGKGRSAMAMSATGAVVSIPVFCDSGYVILSPLARSLAARSNASMATYALALATGLVTTHVFVPPTPGPIAGAQELGADVGLVIILGIVVSIPVLIATYFYALFQGNRVYIDPETVSIDQGQDETPVEKQKGRRPSTFAAFLPIGLPILLIALNSVAELDARPFGDGIIASVLTFLGNPNTALIIGVFIAFFVTADHAGESITHDAVTRALRVAGPIILITGAGGALGGVLRETPITSFLGDNLALTSLGMFLPFLLAAALKTAQGSSTVAIVTTAAIIAPLTGSLGLESGTDLALTTLAIGAGSVMVSHANDSYFWVVTQFSGMSVAQGYKLYTVATAVTGIVGIATIWILSLIL